MPGSHNLLLEQKCFCGTNIRKQHLDRTLSTMQPKLHCMLIYHDTISCMYKYQSQIQDFPKEAAPFV